MTTEAGQKRFSPKGDERKKLAADVAKNYKTGLSIRAVAEELGLSYGLTHRLLLEGKNRLRARSSRRTK